MTSSKALRAAGRQAPKKHSSSPKAAKAPEEHIKAKLVPEITEYLEIVESGSIRACREQHQLCKYIRKVFDTEDIYVDATQLGHYMSLQKYLPFQLFPWQRFLIALWLCTYTADGHPRWKTLVAMIARGAGKDGFIAFCSFCLTSPYNPVPFYDVDICANEEEQSMRPVRDLLNFFQGPNEAALRKHYKWTKEQILGLANKGTIRGRTNNPKSRDGMRSGAVIFNEVHAFTGYENIKVFVTGQGKTEQPRRGIFTSNGEVSEGPLDDYLATGQRILFEGAEDNGFLPFICRLDDREEVKDPDNWFKANPSLAYLPSLYEETKDEFRDWLEHPEQNGDFLTKRMGIRAIVTDVALTEYDKLLETKKELPDLRGKACVVGIDYAELSDWASVNLHFRIGNDRYDINHAWICRDSKTLSKIKAPWREWVTAGHCTFVEDVSISPQLIIEYIAQSARMYNVKLIALDSFRYALMSEALRSIGFDARDKSRVKLVRPTDIMRLDPVVQECFDRGYFYWGDNPCLRWAANNVKRVRSSRKQGSDTGNFYYAKIEARSRKTDPWMALSAAMACEDILGNGLPVSVPIIGAINF